MSNLRRGPLFVTVAGVASMVALGVCHILAPAQAGPSQGGGSAASAAPALPFGLTETTLVSYTAATDGAPTANGMTCSTACPVVGTTAQTTDGLISYTGTGADLTTGLYLKWRGVLGGLGLNVFLKAWTGNRVFAIYVTAGGNLNEQGSATWFHAGGAGFEAATHTIEVIIPPGSSTAWIYVDNLPANQAGARTISVGSFAADASNYGFSLGWFAGSGAAHQVETLDFRIVTP